MTPDRGTLRLGINGGSDFAASWILPLYDDLEYPETRIELDATQDPATAAADLRALADRHVRPLVLAGYGNAWPTLAQVDRFCGTAAAMYGPGGTAGFSDDVAMRYIEFGNESSYSYMGPAMYNRADRYAELLEACADSARAANPFVGVLAIADDPVGVRDWVWMIYQNVTDPDTKLAGWTTHPYGPSRRDPSSYWFYSLDSALEQLDEVSSALPLVATEYGIATTSGGTTLNDNFGWPTNMTWADGAAAFADTLDELKSVPHLTELYWYVLHDGAVDDGLNNDREDFFGLLQYDLDTARGPLFDLFTRTVAAGGW